MLTEKEWQSFHAARKARAQQVGKAIYLLDGNGEPIMEISEYTDLSAPQADAELSSLKLTVPIDVEYGDRHPLVHELVAENLGVQDDEGRLKLAKTKTRMVLVEHKNGARFCYRITHVVASGGHLYPTELEINGVDTTSILSRLPAFSVRLSVSGVWRRLANDYGRIFEKERDIQTFEVAKIADGFTKSGRADEVITQIIRESLDALYKAFNITRDVDKPYTVRRVQKGRNSPVAYITLKDDDILSTIKNAAESAGVGIRSTMVFPYEGDSSVLAPQIIFIVSQR